MKKTHLLFFTIFTFALLKVGAQNCSYSELTYTTSGFPTYMLSGDFNNDGKADLIQESGIPFSITAYLQMPGNTFSTVTTITSTSQYLLVVNDFNNDGNDDVLLTGGILYAGLGNGIFSATTTNLYFSNSSFNNPINPIAISSDVNNDGMQDVISMVNAVPISSLSINLGMGNGNFGSSISYTLNGLISPFILLGLINNSCISAKDINNDTYIDVVAAVTNTSSSISTLYIFNGSPSGTLSPINTYTYAGEMLSVKLNDFNLDGSLDIAYSNQNVINVLNGNGSGSFSPSQSYTVAGANMILLESGDLNNDLIPDITSLNLSGPTFPALGYYKTYTNFLNNGSQLFNSSLTYTMGDMGFPNPIICKDFNSDGYLDLAVNTYSFYPTLYVFLTSPVLNGSIITANNGAICVGQSFTINPSGANSYIYSGGSAVITPTITSSYSIAGTYSNGCVTSNTAIVTITVNPLPTITVNSGTICSGDSFTIIPNGATNYTYSSGSNIISPITSTAVTIVGASAQGCVSSNTVTSSITVNPLPHVIASTSSSIICSGETATLTANGASTYTWNGGATTSVISISPSLTTVYGIIGTDINGCDNSVSITQSVSACTGISSEIFNQVNQINVYPNPNKGEFVISGKQEATFLMVDALGQVIKTISLNATNHYSESISGLANGMYFLVDKNNLAASVKYKIIVIQ